MEFLPLERFLFLHLADPLLPSFELADEFLRAAELLEIVLVNK